MLPWVLQDIDRAILMDTDMIFLEDPARLWDEFDAQQWLYKMPIHSMRKGSGFICSCVVLLKMDQIRHSNIFPTLMEEALLSQPTWEENGLYKTPHGDQGLYFAMMLQDKQNLFAALPPKWAKCPCKVCHHMLVRRHQRRRGLNLSSRSQHRSPRSQESMAPQGPGF